MLMFLWPYFSNYEKKVVFKGAKKEIDSFPTKIEAAEK